MTYHELQKRIEKIETALEESNNAYLTLNKSQILKDVEECKVEIKRMLCLILEVNELDKKIDDISASLRKYHKRIIIPKYHNINGIELALDRACRKKKILQGIIDEKMAEEKVALKPDLEAIISAIKVKFAKM